VFAEKAAVVRAAFIPGGSTALSYVLDAAAKKFAVGFQPAESFTLAKVAVKFASLTGTPTASLRVETDASGRPSGTLAWANAEVTGHAVANGWTNELSLTASGTLSAGTLYHLVVANTHATPASNNFAVADQATTNYWTGGVAQDFHNSYTASFGGASWANRFGPVFMLANSDGSHREGQPFDSNSSQTLHATTGYGVKFTSGVTGTLIGGVLSHLPLTGNGAVTGKLYDSSNTLLGTATLTAGLNTVLVNARGSRAFTFDGGGAAVAAGQDYRLVFLDSAGVGILDYVTAPSAPTDYRQVASVAAQVQWTQGTTAGWTDTPGKLPAGLVVYASDVSAGGGGGGGTFFRRGGLVCKL
jgi:hypothetical protein